MIIIILIFHNMIIIILIFPIMIMIILMDLIMIIFILILIARYGRRLTHRLGSILAEPLHPREVTTDHCPTERIS